MSRRSLGATLVAVLVLLAALPAAAAQAPADDLRVMSFNLRFASDTPPNSWPERRPVTRRLLRESARRLHPLEHDHFWLSDTPDVIGSQTWGGCCPRMVTWVRFLDRRTGEQLYAVNTRTSRRSTPTRARSSHDCCSSAGSPHGPRLETAVAIVRLRNWLHARDDRQQAQMAAFTASAGAALRLRLPRRLPS